MQQTSEVRVGMLGLGFMGATHAKAWQDIAGARLQAVSGRDPVRLGGDFRAVGGNLGTEFGVLDFSAVTGYREWQQLVADPAIDVVDICLPTKLHAEVGLAALRAGKHVFSEKPMALTDEECQALLEAAEASERTLMVGHVLRFFPEYQWLKEAVTSKRYGNVLQATFTRQCGLPDWSNWLPNSEESGGALIDLLIHDLDAAIWVLGMPGKVTAKSMGPEDTVMASLLYPSVPEVRVQGGWFPAGAPFAMGYRVRFEQAEAEFTAGEVFLSDHLGQRSSMVLDKVDPYRVQLEYFLQCCREGLYPEVCPPEESAQAVRLANCVKQSRSEGGSQISCLD